MIIELIPLATFVIATTFTPGPNNISSAAMGISFGYRRTLPYLGGIFSGFALVMLACAFMSATLLTLIPALQEYLRWIGAAYILYLAWCTLKASYSFQGKDAVQSAFGRGFALQLFNPKVAVYGLTLYTTFLAEATGHLELLLASSFIFAATAFAATSTWALCGAAIRHNLQNEAFRRAVNLTLALLLVYTAVDLLGLFS